MNLTFIGKFWLILFSAFYFYSSGLMAETPCVSNPTLDSRDMNNIAKTVICNGSPLRLATTGTTSVANCPTCTYEWSNGDVGAYTFIFTPGLYRVTVTDNAPGGCVGVSSDITITASTLAQPTLQRDSISVCTEAVSGTISDAVLEVTNPCLGCTYNWYESSAPSAVLGPTGVGAGGLTYTTNMPGEYYVQVTDGSGCTQTSTVTIVNAVTVSQPPINASTNYLCDSNATILSTVNCTDCEYEWHFYDFPDTGRLIITGVFNGPLNGTGGFNGVELYAIGNISDLSRYSLDVIINGNPSSAGIGAFQFPARSLSAGSYLYVTDSLVNFDNFFGFRADYADDEMHNISGDDQVDLLLDGVRIDRMGNFGITSDHTARWINRNDNSVPKTIFDPNDWFIQPLSWVGVDAICPDNTNCIDTTTPSSYIGYPVQDFVPQNTPGTIQQTIPSLDTSTFTTKVLGYYSVQVTYRNGCAIETPVTLIDTAAFKPRITFEMPGNASLQALFLDTTYLCDQSYVDLKTVNPFLAPPSWSYQWFLNGDTLAGATGYNQRVDTIGRFTLRVTNDNGCSAESDPLVILRPSNSNIASPVVTASSIYNCVDGAGNSIGPEILLSTTPCTNCLYEWIRETGVGETNAFGNSSQFPLRGVSSISGGYFVRKTDNLSSCIYDSPILEIKDTIYPAPTLITIGDVSCATNPALLSVPPCSGCIYNWIRESPSLPSNQGPVTLSTGQNTEQIDTSGNYRVYIEYTNIGCTSDTSNTIRATFQTINANILTPPLLSICNGDPVEIEALPDTANCIDCKYEFLRDGIPMQARDTTYKQFIEFQGDYQVVVTNPEGCADTSQAITFEEINISTTIRSSATKICDPTSSVLMEIDSCDGCSYQWLLGGGTPLISNQDTFLVITGAGSQGGYLVEVSKSGCVVSDSVYIGLVNPPLAVQIVLDSTSFAAGITPSPTLCDGSTVVLTDVCDSCALNNDYTYQWQLNNSTISGATFESYRVDSVGSYTVVVVDSNNCTATSNAIVVQGFSPPTNFALDFTPLGPAVPVTFGTFNLDNYLQPTSLRTDPTGGYSSLTTGGAINGDSINVGVAGSGRHFITFTYTAGNMQGSCEFSTFDTLEVLGAVDIQIANTNPAAPASEACLFDTLQITLTNFTFIPSEVIFVAGGGNTISVPVAPVLAQFAGVYSGDFTVVVPDGARTGKITVADTVSSFEAPNFFVIQNPAVGIGIANTTQPVCANLDTAVFLGVPGGGIFEAYYPGMAVNNGLLSDSLLLLDSITGYVAGVQNVVIKYTFTPTYTGTNIGCPTIEDTLLVEIRDTKLDSVTYTPISITQVSEPLSNLTLTTHPITALNYPNSYTGTHVLANNLLPSTVNGGIPGVDTVTYEINNGGCVNSSEDEIDIWRKPALLDSLPQYLCSKDDTVFIYRDASNLRVIYRGVTVYSDTLYRYSTNPNGIIGNPASPDVRYQEQINSMVITSSNGGIVANSTVAGNEEYLFIPGDVTGTSTQLTFQFDYDRQTQFFANNVIVNTQTVNYRIAEVSKLFLIETPSQVAINPVILADTVFCPVNSNTLLLGQPGGGQYFINGAPLAGNIFNPLTSGYPLGNSYGLTYVYTGNACVDSAYTGIYLPDSFNIQVLPGNGTGIYCKTSPNDTILFSATPPTHPIDTASAQFFIGGVQSGVIFSPVQVGPPGDYAVEYAVADIYGCVERAAATFTVYPVPTIATSPLAPQYCLNNDTVRIHLYQIDTNGVQNELTYQPPNGTGIGYIQNDSASLFGNGVIDGGIRPATPYFYAQAAGVGLHRISFVYSDSNACMDSVIQMVEVLPLPQVSMKASTGLPLLTFYCEYDSIGLRGEPIGPISGYGSEVITTYPNGSPIPTSLDSADTSFEPFVAGSQPGIVEELLFYYFEDNNGCRDTASYTVFIRNFTTDPTLVGLPDTLCASDGTYPIVATPDPTGFNLDSLGWYTSSVGAGFSILGDTNKTATTDFYPDSANIVYADRSVILTYTYTDTAKVCTTSVADTVFIRALPFLTLSEDISTQDFLGSPVQSLKLDSFFHICETDPERAIFAFNTTGTYDPFTNQIFLSTPDQISPDTGRYSSGRGVVPNNSTGVAAYGYIADSAGYGLDTLRYVYTDARGCTDSVEHLIFVDSLPDLSFARLSNYDASINRYVYCETDPNPPLIFAAPTGVSWTLTFGGQQLNDIQFQLRPDTLAVPNMYVDYELRYDFIGQIYEDGNVCRDSLIDTIQIRPAPQLAWVNAPTTHCLLDPNERVPLSATPRGGQFIDATNNFQVVAGIVGDTLFNPAAQAGHRDIYYYYLDPTSGCDDTIQRRITVYNKPQINFDISGGCTGTVVNFTPRTADYGMTYNGVAIDSLTSVIWDYGDGVADTFNYLPDTLIIPTTSHTYAGAGIFFPSLTVVNQNTCDTTFVRRIVISPKKIPTDSFPYLEDFTGAGHGWIQETSDTASVNGIVQDSLWQWGIATGSQIQTSIAGNPAWVTRLAGTYGRGENAWVYSPCFDLTNLTRPMIELDIWRETQETIDGAVLQYFDDSTQTWEVLGEYGKGINWYQDGYTVSSPGNQINAPVGWNGNAGLSTTWENARYRLDNIGNDLRGRDNVRFRVAFASSPNTVPNQHDGFAFDNVKIGNRQRHVLVEHFSGSGYPGIVQLDQDLYRTVYNNLYGRDASIIQYNMNLINSNDPLYLINPVDNDERAYFYRTSRAIDVVRVDGKNTVGQTSQLLNYPSLESLDIDMLADPKFDVEFVGFPAVIVDPNSGRIQANVKVTAMQAMADSSYSLHVVITEDSLVGGSGSNHITMGVLRDMYPNNAGTIMPYARGGAPGDGWLPGNDSTVNVNWIPPTLNIVQYSSPNPIQLQVVAFMQNMETQEVYQVATSRDLTQFQGPVDTLDVSIEKIEDHPGYEVATLKLYPNPTENQFQVDFEEALEDNYEWQLVDMVGRVLKQGIVEPGTTNMQVQTNDLSTGMYIFVVRNAGVHTQRKVIVRRY